MAQYKSFYKLLESLADKYNDKAAVLYDTFEVSYRKLFDDSVKKHFICSILTVIELPFTDRLHTDGLLICSERFLPEKMRHLSIFLFRMISDLK